MQPLAQPPRKEDRSFDDWMFRLWKRIASTAGLSWELVDKSGSNLTDIATRNHADLQNINTATYTHLSSTNATDLTDGGDTTLHTHDFERVTWPSTIKINSPTHLATLQDTLNHLWSSGLVDGGALTDNGDGTVTIAAGTAVTHATTDPHTDIYQVVVPQDTLSLTDGVASYIYVDYNSGSPIYAVGTSSADFNCIDKCIIYLAHRSGTSVHYIDAREQNVDGNRKTRRLFLDFSKFIHAENGTVLGASGLAITLTAGKFYFMLQEIAHVAFDTSVAGTDNANVFTLWNHVSGVYAPTIESKVISTTLYDDGTDTATLGNNKYGVTWFYVMNDAPSELHAVMGQVEYANAEEAEAASPPATLPGILASLGSLVGYVIYEKSAVAFYDVRSAFQQRFSSSAATLHNGLGGLQGGAVNEYYHLTSTQHSLIPSGTPSAGQVPIATSGTASAWGTISASGSDWPLHKETIDVGETLTVTSGYQYLIAHGLENSGTLVNDGEIYVIGENSGFAALTSSDVTTALGYTPPTPTGTGASGTWSISITNGVYTTDAGTVFLAPNGSAASLTSFPTLNQNTTGTATGLSGGGVVKTSVTNVATSPYTVLAADANIRYTNAATGTITLPSAASYNGREITIRTERAYAVSSASSNVRIDLTLGSSILPATAGKWAKLVSDGTDWIMMENN